MKRPKPGARHHASTGASRSTPRSEALLIVGIGASAGGLASYNAFFLHMPPDPGMAFVLVQHLDPHHKSALVELLSKQTRMKVAEAEDGAVVAADQVFIIPPDATLTISKGRLRVTRPAPPREYRRPIDSFFTSLAEDQGENAISIVLSGSGSDGSIGLRAIKEHGGLVLAQADFDHFPQSGMPQSAAATGLVDQVLPVEEMPARLIEYRRHLGKVADRKDGDGIPHDGVRHLPKVAEVLRTTVGHDFSRYKKSTLLRRIQRRMQVLQIDTVPAFVERLRKEPREVELLFRELLIGVTRFFREPRAFEALTATVLPSLLANRAADDQLRIWVPACSTGEEVYSIAILVKETMERLGSALPVQIFGTDIDGDAVGLARSGRYARSMDGLSPARIKRWFVEDGDVYVPVRAIRELCAFSVHSVIRDPPFSKLDLISCRNLLIYFEADLQDRVLQTFHYALRPGGFLMMGPSETVSRSAKLFVALGKGFRLYRRRETGRMADLPAFQPVKPAIEAHPHQALPIAAPRSQDRLDKQARRQLERYAPAFVVINKQHEILHFSGESAARYLTHPPGAPNLDLFAMLAKGLRAAARAALGEAIEKRAPVEHEAVSTTIEGRPRDVVVIVEPMGGAAPDAALYVIAFREQDRPRSRASKGDRGSDAALQALEHELRSARTQHQASIDELETSNEELKSSNEEYQAVYEELQSANEELETSKEELQSTNEELQTVNTELNAKNEAVMRLNSDLRNLLESTEIATLFLDTDLRVKSFTPGMSDLFNLRPGDVGRPITDLASQLAYDRLPRDVAKVLRDLGVVEREIRASEDDRAFLMRIRPYRTVERVIDGVVLTFVDISERLRAELIQREHAAIVEFSSDALIGLTLEGTVRSWNPAAVRLYGYATREAVGRPVSILAPSDRVREQTDLFRGARSGRTAGPLDTVHRHKDGSAIDVEVTFMPIQGADGRAVSVAMSARNIGERKGEDRHRTLLLHELSHRVKNALMAVQTIAAHTLKGTPSPEAFERVFTARLQALAKTHDLLTRREWRDAPLRDVVETELTPYRRGGTTPWSADGPNVALDPKTALALGMGLHELATNAVKYGALSVPGGRVEVTWRNKRSKDGSRITFQWIETGGPRVAKPPRKGFGTRLIERGLKFELDGDVQLRFEPGGVRCTIEFSLEPEPHP